MGSKRIDAARDKLRAVLTPLVPEDNLDETCEAIEELGAALAEEQSDRDNERGDWHRWD